MFFIRVRGKPKVSTLTKLTESLLRNLPINPTQLRQQHQQQQQRKKSDTSKKPTKVPQKTYNTPHPPKDPPENYNPTSFKHVAFDAPNYLPFSIWRPFQTAEEKLGPNAAKSSQYKNPEYYSYHRYSFFEIQRNVLEIRKKKVDGSDIRTVYDYEVEEDVEIGDDGKVKEKTCDDDKTSNESHDNVSCECKDSDD